MSCWSQDSTGTEVPPRLVRLKVARCAIERGWAGTLLGPQTRRRPPWRRMGPAAVPSQPGPSLASATGLCGSGSPPAVEAGPKSRAGSSVREANVPSTSSARSACAQDTAAFSAGAVSRARGGRHGAVPAGPGSLVPCALGRAGLPRPPRVPPSRKRRCERRHSRGEAGPALRPFLPFDPSIGLFVRPSVRPERAAAAGAAGPRVRRGPWPCPGGGARAGRDGARVGFPDAGPRPAPGMRARVG
jgi:hypothetical protein